MIVKLEDYDFDKHEGRRPLFIKGCALIIAAMVFVALGAVFMLGTLSVVYKVPPGKLLSGRANLTGTPEKTEDKAADKKKGDLDLLPIEANIVKYTNAQRARYGLPPLQVDKDLMKSARQHGAWMARHRNMVHTRRNVAENIAMGQRSSDSVVRAWMNSRGHRANILNRSYHRIGVAAYRTASGTIYWCQQFRR